MALGAAGASSADHDDSEPLVPGGEPAAIIPPSPDTWRSMGDVRALAVRADGAVAVATSDGNVRLWQDALTGARERAGFRARILPRDGASPLALAFGARGETLAIGTTDGSVELWRSGRTEPYRVFRGHQGPVHSVAITNDGSVVASASEDHSIRLWNVAQGTEAKVLTEHEGPVYSVAFSPDASRLASASQDKTIHVWSTASHELQQTLEDHEGPVYAVAFDQYGKTLASASADKTVKIWPVGGSRPLKTFENQETLVRSLAFARDSPLLAGGAENGTVQMWNISTFKAVNKLHSHRGAVQAVAFHPRNAAVLVMGTAAPRLEIGEKKLSLGATEGAVTLRNILPGSERSKPISLLGGRIDAVMDLSFRSDGRILASTSSDNAVRLWHVDTGQKLQVLVEPTSRILSLAFLPKNNEIALGLDDNTVRLIDEESGTENRALSGHQKAIHQLSFSADGENLATASADGTVRLWSLVTRRQLHVLRHTGEVSAVSFSPSSPVLASGSTDGIVRLWQSKTGKRLRARTMKHKGAVTSVAFSHQGTMLASSSKDTTIKLWNSSNGRLSRTLIGHADEVTKVVFSPKGLWLASASKDKTVRLWDPRTGKELLTLGLHDEAVHSLAFMPNTSDFILASGSYDGSIHLTRLQIRPRGREHALESQSEMMMRGARAGWLIQKSEDASGARVYRHDDGQFLLRRFDDVIASVAPEPKAAPQLSSSFKLIRGNQSGRALGHVEATVTNAKNAGPAYWVHVSVVGLPNRVAFAPSLPRLRLDPGDTATLRIDLGGDVALSRDDQIRLRIVHAYEDERASVITNLNLYREEAPDVPTLRVTIPWTTYALVALTLFVLLVIGVTYVRVYRHPIVVGVLQEAQRLDGFPLGKLPEVNRVLHRARRLKAALALQSISAERWDRAVNAAVSQSHAIRSFADALGAKLRQPIDTGSLGAFVAREVDLPALQVRFAQASAVAAVGGRTLEHGGAVAVAQAIHRQGAGPERAIVLDLTSEQDAGKHLHKVPRVTFVVLSMDELRDMIFDERPDLRLEAAMVNQLKVADLSPFELAGGVKHKSLFFGRERELRTMGDRSLRSFILVGARQMGKTTLLKALKRRLDARADVEVHYVTLANENLGYHLQHHLEGTASSEPISPEEFRELAAGKFGPRLWLLDEADRFVQQDAKNNCELTNVMRQLSQDGEAYFVLTGYWFLYEAAVRNNRHPLFNFAEIIRLGPLDTEDAVQLATQPMASLGLKWDSPQTYERLVMGAGCRANLIVLACKALIGNLAPDTSTLTRERLEHVVEDDRDLRDALRIHDLLDRIIVFQAVRMGAPSRSSLVSSLLDKGLQAGRDKLEQVFDRLELSYVLLPDPTQNDKLIVPVPFTSEQIKRGGNLDARIDDLILMWNDNPNE